MAISNSKTIEKIMIIFIELNGVYKKTDGPDFESMGIEAAYDMQDTAIIPTLVNINHIVQINPFDQGYVVVEYPSGERFRFKNNYDKIRELLKIFRSDRGAAPILIIKPSLNYGK